MKKILFLSCALAACAYSNAQARIVIETAPAPVYAAPAPVYVQPAPVYAEPYPYYYRGYHRHRYDWGYWHDRGYRRY